LAEQRFPRPFGCLALQFGAVSSPWGSLPGGVAAARFDLRVPSRVSLEGGTRSRDRLEGGGLREGPMANKDKGGKSNKKAASQDLKEKRAAKKSKREAKNAKNVG